MFEGAQATLLDIDFGTYPYVTSSHPIAAGACIGTGVGPKMITNIIGVAKAYTTRVGKGPFPTELNDETGDVIRNKGGEFGTTTGRPRRTGWFDAVIVRHSVRTNGLDGLAINKLDTLSGIGTLKMCVGYQKPDGTVLKDFPAALESLADCAPIYEEFEGFDEDISNCKSFDELPEACKKYIARLEEVCECKVVMVGNEAECKAAAAAGNFDISAAEIIDPENYAGFDEMVSTMVELRKGKQSAEECTALLKKSNYFGTMLVKMGKADCLLGGATYSTADTIRPALQLVKTKKGAHLVSSCFILDRDCGEEGLKRIAMGDCAVNIDYTDTVDKATGEVKVSAASKLAEVAVETARTAKLFGIDPKVAVLSFSTKGSGKGGTVALSHDATIKAQEMDPELAVDGELQFDAAVAPEVAQVKCKGSKVAGQANTFIFPCIEAGNIGYKIAQRLGGYAAYGPILQGLNAPINDLSRGCNADEVYKMSLITACQS